jgi:uracil-DNA glycosylase
MNRRSLLAAYARQQKELGMPDPVFGDGGKAKKLLKSIGTPAEVQGVSRPPAAAPVSRPPVSPVRNVGAPASLKSPYGRLSRLSPIGAAVAEPKPPYREAPAEVALTPGGHLTFEQKREIFKGMYGARCDRCVLAKTRTTFVFGSGNVDAPLMVIGEAPGAEEDAQGLPFVGAAGHLLTELLSGVAIDRKKDVFITNVLKCRPPGNRTPDAAEIIQCLPLLRKQIEVIAPRLLLLLGRIAAHAVLGTTDSIAKMRSRTHEYQGVPAIVTYHPAAILRNPEYRGPTDEDLQKAVSLLNRKG